MLEALFEHAADGLLVTDKRGAILWANPAFWAMFGRLSGDRRCVGIHQLAEVGKVGLIPPADSAEYEIEAIKKDGTRFPALLSLVKIINSGEHYYTGHMRDLSQEKNNANSLAREQQLGKLKSRLVSMASHEFRSPLSQIQLSASLIERYYQRLDQDKILAHLRKIRVAVNDMTDTLDDFLSLERIEAGAFQPELRSFDLVIFGEEICAQMQLAAGRHELVYHHEGRQQVVCSDRNVLKHCVVNLLSNAVKYSVETGRILLKTTVAPDTYSITVSDRGIGIPQDEQKRLFEPFFRASNAAEVAGTGLGLHIVQNYVRQLGGEIHLKSYEKKGTTFSLVFPLLSPQTVVPAHPAA